MKTVEINSLTEIGGINARAIFPDAFHEVEFSPGRSRRRMELQPNGFSAWGSGESRGRLEPSESLYREY
jgi:hypothetical protein